MSKTLTIEQALNSHYNSTPPLAIDISITKELVELSILPPIWYPGALQALNDPVRNSVWEHALFLWRKLEEDGRL